MSLFRAFPGLVVREDSARNFVTPLSASDLPDAGRVGPALDPAAYQTCPPSLFVYRQHGDGASHTGLVCEVAIEAFADGRVRGHEAVDPQRVEALILHRTTATGPPALVTLLHRAGDAFTRLVDETTRAAPMLDFAIPGGLQQTVWRVPDGPAAERALESLSAADHYIADGHHRVTAALEEWRTDGRPADAGLLCVVLPMEDLTLSAFHRLVSGPVDPDELLGLLATDFDVREEAAPPAPRPGSFGLYVGRRWFGVTSRGAHGDGVEGLDISVLETRVLRHVDKLVPGPSYAVEIVPPRTPVAQLTRRCDAEGGALFTLAPPPLATLTALADAGVVMPPKTTSFEPKPATGIFLHQVP